MSTSTGLWYELQQDHSSRILYGTFSKETSFVIFKIPLFKQLLCTECYKSVDNGHSIIEVPKSQFRLKILHINNLMRYYLQVNDYVLKPFVRCELICNGGAFDKCNFTLETGDWKECCANRHNRSYGGGESGLILNIKICRWVPLNLPVGRCLGGSIVSLKTLALDLGHILTEGINSDVTLTSVEGQEFKLHKIILAARSKVLKAHFEHNTAETVSHMVETHWEADVLQDIVTFLYTGTIPGIEKSSEKRKLFAAADFYELDSLKSLMTESITNQLTIDNAIGMLQLALLYSAGTLICNVLKFIKDGRTGLITQSEAWANLQSEDFNLIKLIYEYITTEDIVKQDIFAAAFKELQKIEEQCI